MIHMRIEELTTALESTSTEVRREAALMLGLLLEKTWAKRRPDDDGGLHDIYGPGLERVTLTESEISSVVQRLAERIASTAVEPMVAWALAKARTPEAISAMWLCLEKHCVSSDPERQAMAINALLGLIASTENWKQRAQAIKPGAIGEVAKVLAARLDEP